MKSKTNKFWLALLISFFLHLVIFFLFKEIGVGSKNFDRPNPVVMVHLETSQEQIVDVAKPEVEEKPKEASAQSLYDVTVKEETVAPPRSVPSVKPQRPASIQQKEKPKEPAKPIEEKPIEPEKGNLQDALARLQKEQKQQEQELLQKFDSTNPPDLSQVKASLPAGEGSFLKDYKIGGKTFINALANPNVSYFVELERKFRITWNPLSALRKNWSGFARGKQFVTVWGLSVDQNGKIARLVLIKKSGVDALDQESKRTILSSAPFSNPPVHLLKEDGQLHMAWSFLVY